MKSLEWMGARGVFAIGTVTALAFACSERERELGQIPNGGSSGESAAGSDAIGAAGTTDDGGAGNSGHSGNAGSSGGSADSGGNAGNAGDSEPGPTNSAGASGSSNQEDACLSKPCEHGGVCSADARGGYECSCASGFSGPNCETNIDECAAAPCKNGGTCTDGVNAYSCSCPSTFTGPACQYLEVKLVPSTFLGGGWDTQATAISNDGKVVLLNASKAGGDNTIGRLVDFGDANSLALPSPYSGGSGFGIDQDGSTIVGSAEGSPNAAFKTVGSVTTMLALSSVAGSADTVATDVSANGSAVIGAWNSGGGGSAFYCLAGQACREVPIPVTSFIFKTATAVSGDGSVVVGYTESADPTTAPGTAFRWDSSAAAAVILSTPSASWTNPRALSISRDKQVIVGSAEISGVSHAVRWSGASLAAADLGLGRAKGTNADGSVTVGADNSGAAVVWMGTTRQTLANILGANPDLTGATLSDAVAVSDDGKVVAGTATIGAAQRAFMVRLP